MTTPEGTLELLDDDLAAHYVARCIADGQPVDAFVYEPPPVLIILASGPFRAQVENTGEPVKPAVDALRDTAATATRRGAKVRIIMIRYRGPTTEAGAGVGSTLAQLQAAHMPTCSWHRSPKPSTGIRAWLRQSGCLGPVHVRDL
jgi:hypothetical protein